MATTQLSPAALPGRRYSFSAKEPGVTYSPEWGETAPARIFTDTAEGRQFTDRAIARIFTDTAPKRYS